MHVEAKDNFWEAVLSFYHILGLELSHQDGQQVLCLFVCNLGLEGLKRKLAWDEEDLGLGPKMCILNKPPGDMGTAWWGWNVTLSH